MRNMEGKVALVSAASKGLGRASALSMARRGAKIGLCSRNADEAAATAEDISKEADVETWHCAADIGTVEGVKNFIEGGAGHFGGVDVLVSNAGGPPPGEFNDFSDDDWRRAFELSVMSAVRLVDAVLPHMKGRGYGRIIFILSSSVREPIPNLTLSNVMRPAVAGLSKSLSRELAGDGILVNVVAPGAVLTDRVRQNRAAFAKKQNISLEESLAVATKQIPLGRLGEPDEFGAMVGFLVSPGASYITGGYILVDGGRLKAI
jgi:3-oxoacyl-[acyl-carrier protein] reductase